MEMIYMNKENFIKEMENIYKKTFKNSKFNASYGCFGNDTLFIKLYLAENTDEVANGLFDNDMFSIMLEVKFYDDELKNMVFSSVLNSYRVKAELEYLYCSHHKVAFRKVKGDYKKVLDTFKKYVDRLYNSILDDIKADNIHNADIELLKKKI